MIDEDIKDIIKKSKTIVVVGASRDSEKAAHLVPKYLQSQGYKIIPINPAAEKILGEKAYSSLQEIDVQVDIIDIFRPSQETPEIVKEAVKLKPKIIWLQLGIYSKEAERIAREHKIKIVMDRCLKIEHMNLS